MVDKHFDKIPDRALHIHDPKKKQKRREEKARQKREERKALGLENSGSEADSEGDDMSGGSSDHKRHSEKGSKTSEPEESFDEEIPRDFDADGKPRTFDDDEVDRYQYPDARNPSYDAAVHNPHVNDPLRFADPRRPFPQAAYPDQPGHYDQYVGGYTNPWGRPIRQTYTPPEWGDENEGITKDQELEHKERKRHSQSHKSRPEVRSRSSHQGDRYYPSSVQDTSSYKDESRSSRHRSRRHRSTSRSRRSSPSSKSNKSHRDSHGNDVQKDLQNLTLDQRFNKVNAQTKEERKDAIEKYFSMSDKGIASGAAGAILGGIAGYKATHGRKKGDVMTSAITGLLGAIVGGAGANAAETAWERKQWEKNNGEERRESPGHRKSVREGRTMTKWQDDEGNGFYEDRSRSRRGGADSKREKSRSRKGEGRRSDESDDYEDESHDSYDDKQRRRRDRRRESSYY